MPLTTSSGYTFPTPGITTTQNPTSGTPYGNSESLSSDQKLKYSDFGGDWLGYLQYMADHGDEASLDKLISYFMSEESADRGRKWTADREDTQYQRMIADIKKAGFNPYALLSSGGSPVSSASSGNTYSGSQFVTSQNNKATQELKDETNQAKIISIITTLMSTMIMATVMAL